MHQSKIVESEKNNILIIADSLSAAETLVALLRDSAKIDFEYRHSKTAGELEIALTERKWAVILCDFVLTSLSASTVIKLIKRSHPTTPIILVSDRATVHDAVDMMRLGAFGFVEKSDYTRLIGFVRQALENRQLIKESYYESIVESQTELICRYDANFRLTFVNRAYSEWYAQPSEALLGSNILDKIPAEYRERAIAHVKTLTFDSPVAKLAYQDSMPGQNPRWIEWTNRAIFDKSGRFIECQSVGRDITAHKIIEETLRIKESALDSSITPYAISDLEGRLTYVNPAFLKLWKFTTEQEVIGQVVLSFWESPIEAQKIVEALGERGYFFGELVARLNDGTNADIELVASLVTDTSGKPVCMMASFMDITQRKQSEQALRISEEKFSKIFSASPDSIVITSIEDGLYVDANESFLRTMGYSREEVIGYSALELNIWVTPEDRNQVGQELLKHGFIHNMEAQYRSKSGENLIGLLSAEVIELSGKRCLLSLVRDITERKKIEEKLRYSEAQQKALLSATPDLLFRITPAGIFVDFHGHKTDLLVPPEAFIGKHIQDILPSWVANRALEAIKQVDTTRQPITFEYEMLFQADIHFFEARFVPLDNTDEVLTIIRDITARKKAEEALRGSEEKYRSLIESSDAAISMVDATGHYLYLNRIAAVPFGVAPEQLIGKTVHELFPPSQANDIIADINRVITLEKGIVLEPEVTLAGKPAWFRTSMQPIRDSTGKPYAALIYASEITDKKLAEIALKANEEKYRSLIESSEATIAMFDEKGKLLYANEIAARQLHFTAETIVGKYMQELFLPAVANYQLASIQEVIKTGKGKVNEARGIVAGEEHWHRTNIQPVRDAFGNITAGLINSIDITEQKKAEETLRTSEKRYRQMFELNGLPKLIVDPQTGRIMDANPAAEKFYGYDLATLKNLHIFDLSLAPSEIIKDTMWHAAVSQILSFISVHRGANGILRDVEVYSGPLEIEGKQFLYSTIIDITEKQRAKAALQEARDLLEQRVVERTAELEKVKDRLEAIFNHSGDGILLLDIEHGIQQANYAFDTLFDVAATSYLDMKLTAFVNPEDASKLEAIVQEVAATHRTRHLETQAKRADGASFEAEISIAPVNRSDKAVSNLVCIIRDITERKQAEVALQKYAAEIYDLYNNAPTGYHSLDSDGFFVQINDTELRWLGYSREEVINKQRVLDFLTPSSQATFRKNFPILKEQGWLKDIEIEFKRKNGTTFPVIVNATAIKNEKGEFVLSRTTIFDITELKKAQQAIAEERNLLRTVIDAVPDYIYFKDTKHRLILSNLSHIKSLKSINLDEVVGKTDFELFPADMAAKFQEDEEQLFRTETRILNLEERSIGQDGTEIWALTTKVPFRNLKGELVGLVGITRDITHIKANEVALLESEQRYRTTIAAMSEGIVLQRGDGAIQLCNSAAERLLGLTTDKILGRTSTDPTWRCVHEDGSPFPGETHPAMIALHTGKPQSNVQMGIHKPDNTVSWLLVNSQPLIDTSQEQPYAVVTTFADITERKEAEAELESKRQAELQMQVYLKTLHDITIRLNRTDTLDEFYRCVVEQGLEHFGFERIGLLLYNSKTAVASGTYGTDIYGNLVTEQHLQLDVNSLTGILTRTLDRNERFAFDEKAELFDNLKPIGIGQNAAAALWNGEALGWLTVDNGVYHKPITQAQLDILVLYALTVGSLMARKHAEFALRESEEKFRMFIESAPISTIVVNTNGKIVLVNKEVEKLFGYKRAELVGQSVEVLVPENSRNSDQRRRSAFMTIPTNRSTDIQEHYARRKDGSIFPVDFKLSYIDTQPAPLVMTFVIDITQRKLAEQSLKQSLAQEKELVELKSRFVSMASHEFRTPLAAILATTETLSTYREKMDGTQIDARLDKIRQQVMHMKDIMEDVLHLARFQAGRIEFKPTRSDLDRLCQEIIEEYESQEHYNQGRIAYESSNSPLMVDYDERLMRQVIGNLVSNALKYSPKEKSIGVSLTYNNGQIVMKVQDDGIGIPSDDLKRLFEPFHRATNVGTISGTGLGLSIAKQAVELHSGTITFESQVGKGTTFIVIFPVKDAIHG